MWAGKSDNNDSIEITGVGVCVQKVHVSSNLKCRCCGEVILTFQKVCYKGMTWISGFLPDPCPWGQASVASVLSSHVPMCHLVCAT